MQRHPGAEAAGGACAAAAGTVVPHSPSLWVVPCVIVIVYRTSAFLPGSVLATSYRCHCVSVFAVTSL